MTEKELMTEMILNTGHWNVPEFTKVLSSKMIDDGEFVFRVLFYAHGFGESEIDITFTEVRHD